MSSICHRMQCVGRQKIRGGIPGWQIHQAQFGVIGHRRPDVRRAAGVSLTGGWTFGGVRITGIPRPCQFAATNVISADHAWWFAGGIVIRHATTDDNHVTGDQRGRGLLVVTRFYFAHVGFQVDSALVAKLYTRLTGFGIDRDQARIAGRQKQTLLTGSRLTVRRGGASE